MIEVKVMYSEGEEKFVAILMTELRKIYDKQFFFSHQAFKHSTDYQEHQKGDLK